MNSKTPTQREITAAYHEAGHAVIYLYKNIHFDFVTIDPKTASEIGDEEGEECRGLVKPKKYPLIDKLTREQLKDYLIAIYAGLEAGLQIDDFVISDGDVVFETFIIEHFVRSTGEDPYNSVSQAQDEVRGEVQQHWSEITKVALALLREKTLTEERVKEIIGGVR